MIHKLAEYEGAENQEEDFERGGYKWTLARGLSHGFTHLFGLKPAKRAKREEWCEEIYREAHEWLKKALA